MAPQMEMTRLKPSSSIAEEEVLVTTPSSPVLAPYDELPGQLEGTDGSDEEDHEHARLLSEDPSYPTPSGKSAVSNSNTSPITTRTLCFATIGIVVLVVTSWLATSLLFCSPLRWMQGRCNQKLEGNRIILSNGTHPWQRTVLMVSIDGLRADYIDRRLTTHLHDISLKGLRAKFITPVFPTVTFPNHWALMTGLYAESHGIVANNFWDPNSGNTFLYTDPKKSWDAVWWNGEPIWETAAKAGMLTANLMWPGPPVTRLGTTPTYYVPFKDHVPMAQKHDQIFEWLDLPFDQRPRLITAYESSVDEAGHHEGPESEAVNNALREIDNFAHSIHQSLAARNLSHIVDVIFVSDHGMTDTSDLRLVYLDDILGEGFSEIVHEDGWPSMGIRFSDKTNVTEMMRRLHEASDKYEHKAFEAYTKETMPERYHFSRNPRIAPVYVIPHLGWALTNRHEHLKIMGGKYVPRGNHGYDNQEPSMRAIFIADGPFSKSAKTKTNSSSGDSADPYVMEGFDNIQVYGLVAKLLGLTPAPNNGTDGFWDAFVD